MTSLQGQHVFISASFPHGARAGEVQPCDPAAITDAVVAMSRAVLLRDGRLALGCNPTLAPVVLTVAKGVGARKAVDVFQSRWFKDSVSEVTHSIAKSGVGAIHFVDALATEAESLLAMRMEILALRPVAAVFVGGMSDVVEEYELVGRQLPATIRLPIAGPGGAAATLPRGDVGRLSERPDLLDAREYPFLASVLFGAIGRETEPKAQKREVKSLGSVSGRVKALDIHGRMVCYVYPASGPARIECSFGDELLDQVKAAVGCHVTVHGAIDYDSTGTFPARVEADRIEVHDGERPRLNDLFGLVPNLTGGMESAAYIRAKRDADGD